MTTNYRMSFRHISPALMALVLPACRDATPPPMPQRPPPVVSVAAAVARDVPVYLDEIGKTIAVEWVAVVPQVGGKIITAPVEDGAYVHREQLLFEIDPRPFQAALDSANAALAQNQAEMAQTQTEYERLADLMKTQNASHIEWEQAKNSLAAMKAKADAAQAAIENAKLNLEYTKIYSPLEGRAGARLIHPGNVVKANDAEFTITENDLGTVRKYMAQRGLEWGDSPEKGLTVLVDLPADSMQVLSALGSPPPASQPGPPATQASKIYAGPREGRLTFLDNAVQTAGGTVKLRATLPNADRYFWPGQFVNVRLVLTTRKDAVLIPTQAQQVGQQGAYVYVVKSDSTAELRPITTGQPQGELLVVDSGLQAGEKVILTGQMMVMPGGKVQVAQDGAAPPAASAPSTALAGS